MRDDAVLRRALPLGRGLGRHERQEEQTLRECLHHLLPPERDTG